MTKVVIQVRLPEFETVFDLLTDIRIRLVTAQGFEPAEVLVWVEGASADEITDALAADPTIVCSRQLESIGNRTLFRVELDSDSVSAGLYRALVALDGVVFDAVATDGVWEADLFLPSRESVSRFHDEMQELGLNPELLSIADGNSESLTESHGLTPTQRETLVTALEKGYFSIPRDITLVEFADELGISDQAASERLRRGIQALVRDTIAREPDLETTQ